MNTFLRYLAVLAPMGQLATAFVASNAVDFDRPDTDAAISVPLYLEPAGLAFAIWPVIFIGFILFGFYQFRAEYRDDARFVLGRKYIVLACLGNMVWFYGDVNNILAVCTIGFTVMLVSLALLNSIFGLGRPSPDIKERWLVKMPISVFFGWITIAFPIGLTLFLITDFGLTGQGFFGSSVWSSVLLVLATVLFSALYLKDRVSTVFPLVGIWGLLWIFIANTGRMPLIAHTALASTILLSVLVLCRKGRTLRSPTKKGSGQLRP